MRHAFRRISAALFIAFGIIYPAQAHPGHNPTDASLSPALLGPDHLGALLVAVVISFCFVRALRWRQRTRTQIS